MKYGFPDACLNPVDRSFTDSRIKQDNHAKKLAEKLAARLDRCTNKRQWDDTAFTLSLLRKDGEVAQKVLQGYRGC